MPVIFPPPIVGSMARCKIVIKRHANKKTAAIIKRAARKEINRKKHRRAIG